jgi:hypothetical protein
MLSHQGQFDQRPDWSVGAEHRIGQLEQRIRSQGQRRVELLPETVKITPSDRGATPLRRTGMRNTEHAATAFVFELCERNPKRIKRWPRPVPQTRRTT